MNHKDFKEYKPFQKKAHLQTTQCQHTSQSLQKSLLCQRTETENMRRIPTEKQEGRSANIGFAKWRVKCFYGSLLQGSSSVFQMKFCAENPPLRKAEKRWQTFTKNENTIYKKATLTLFDIRNTMVSTRNNSRYL